jgi:lysophospholipase L1-like esterase
VSVKPHTSRWLQHTCIVICSILFTLLAAEFGLRLSGLWQIVNYEDGNYFPPSHIPGVPYRLKSNISATWAGTRIVSNSEGIRSEKDYDKAHPGIFRVLAIGDSITFGMGVDQGDAYPKQLEYLLNTYGKNASRYEVINAGISGFNAADEAHFMSYLAAAYHPDLIVWLLIQNDYDNSLGITPDGRMTNDIPGDIATSAWLEQTWGLSGPYIDTENFLNSMDETHRRLAEGMGYDECMTWWTQICSNLGRHSYLFNYFANRIMNYCKERFSREQPGKGRILRDVPIRLADGFEDVLPQISTNFVCPVYSQPFSAAISEGIGSAVKHKIPLVILGLDMLLEQAPSWKDENVVMEDLSEYMPMSVYAFKRRYNLGWDGHLNKKGNRLLAKAVLHVLIKHGLVNWDQHTPIEKVDQTEYWERYKRELADYRSHLKGFVDFKRFQNIHQILGGIFPPCVFPIKKRSETIACAKG